VQSALVPEQWIALGLVLLPLVVSAGILIFQVGNDYPGLDWALTEIRTSASATIRCSSVVLPRRLESSRTDELLPCWSVSLDGAPRSVYGSGALINGVAIVYMAVVARRRGGVALMMCVLLGARCCRTLGADYVATRGTAPSPFAIAG
jgi:hypothetical protein